MLYRLGVGIICATVLSSLGPGCHPEGRVGEVMPDQGHSVVDGWVTNPDRTAMFSPQQPLELSRQFDESAPTIDIKPLETYQTMDGFGYSLTGGSAMVIHRMGASERTALLQELFGVEGAQIGVSCLRLSIGASDLSAYPFTYDDQPRGKSDVDLEDFDLGPDYDDVIPVLKEILAISPDLFIMGSPWTAPPWMKSNQSFVGGSLLPEYYDTYARYLVKYVQEMAEEGIVIDAITVQNEPRYGGNNPSMTMTWQEQATFVKQSLGPAFAAAQLRTKIIIWDHNADGTDYPINILNDEEARQYIDGSAFHLYGGSVADLMKVHDAHPDKNLYFTEQYTAATGDFFGDVAWHMENVMIGSSRHRSRVALQWNLAADPRQDPHTEGGCDICLGALTIDGNEVTRNPAYYNVAHMARFVRPGSQRIGSNVPDKLPNVAFRTPHGELVLVVLNAGAESTSVNVGYDEKYATVSLQPGSVATIVFR